ncbi:MAG: hypothetical protein ACLFVO_04620 [Chloroflexaceae bacterium]
MHRSSAALHTPYPDYLSKFIGRIGRSRQSVADPVGIHRLKPGLQ